MHFSTFKFQPTDMTTTTATAKKLQLIKGEFTPSDALDMVGAMFDQKINYHKIQRLKNWEYDHQTDLGYLEGRIKELVEEKQKIIDFLGMAQRSGSKVVVNSKVEIALSNPDAQPMPDLSASN